MTDSSPRSSGTSSALGRALSLVADENIPCLDALFGDIAKITRLPGRRITAGDLAEADALLVRSITRVDPSLLAASSLSFVGSCTIGTDHIDLSSLASRGITFANAPGCNAAAVVDYVVAAMLATDPDLAAWRKKRAGIIGLGEVGGRLRQRLTALGIATLAVDPFKPEATNTLAEVLSCDLVSLHVPLTKSGEHPTWHLLGERELGLLPEAALLINSSRGPVVDNQALMARMANKKLRVVLDVYEEEPSPDPALLAKLDIATAHIAGYSLEGKVRGSLQVADAFYRHFAVAKPLPDLLAGVSASVETVAGDGLADIVRKAYDIRADSAAFLALYGSGSDAASRAALFDRYRKEYPDRHEFSHTRVGGVVEDELRDVVTCLFC